jgi:hypothetical protein
MVRWLSSLPPTFPLLTALTVAPWARSDAKYESLDKSAQGRYKDLEKKSASALSKAEKDAANTEAKLKKEAAAAAVMAEEKYSSLVADKKAAEQGAYTAALSALIQMDCVLCCDRLTLPCLHAQHRPAKEIGRLSSCIGKDTGDNG